MTCSWHWHAVCHSNPQSMLSNVFNKHTHRCRTPRIFAYRPKASAGTSLGSLHSMNPTHADIDIILWNCVALQQRPNRTKQVNNLIDLSVISHCIMDDVNCNNVNWNKLLEAFLTYTHIVRSSDSSSLKSTLWMSIYDTNCGMRDVYLAICGCLECYNCPPYREQSTNRRARLIGLINSDMLVGMCRNCTAHCTLSIPKHQNILEFPGSNQSNERVRYLLLSAHLWVLCIAYRAEQLTTRGAWIAPRHSIINEYNTEREREIYSELLRMKTRRKKKFPAFCIELNTWLATSATQKCHHLMDCNCPGNAHTLWNSIDFTAPTHNVCILLTVTKRCRSIQMVVRLPFTPRMHDHDHRHLGRTKDGPNESDQL